MAKPLERAVAPAGEVLKAGGWGEHDAEGRFAVFDQRDVDGELSGFLDELLGAVEWVDEPKAIPTHALLGADAFRFLGQYRDVRRQLCERRDDAVVCGAVGLCEWRVVFFGFHLGRAIVGFHDGVAGLGRNASYVVYHFKIKPSLRRETWPTGPFEFAGTPAS